MRNYKYILLYLLILAGPGLQAQLPDVYPTNWWVNMKDPNLQLMLHGKDIGKATVSLQSYAGVRLVKKTTAENSNYLFLDLQVQAGARPGFLQLPVTYANGRKETLRYELKARRAGKGSRYAQGVDAADLVYLLIPDRFSNGDPANDRIPGLLDQSLNRDSIFHRHGGDLKGVMNHLGYLQDLGITALWMLPVWQNNMPDRTEHGYAITNHYQVEPRLGSNADYAALSDSLHARGMKLVQDAVYNHTGLYHFFVQDKPMADWLHEWPSYTGTSYKDQVLFDPYASKQDRKKMVDGWFTPMMPDLNQNNPFVARFLIQHAIWSVEAFGVDGFRIDTYIYNDQEFMNRCNQALLQEYPRLSIFGETWVHGVINQAYFCENNLNTSFKSNLPATTDFQLLFYGIQEALTKPFGWTDGVNRLYTTAAQDILYKDPLQQVIFLDNHDLPRFYSVLSEDTAKYKMALSWLLTFRGIPQLYYGNENLMTGFTNPDGWVRLDFKGGWPGDPVNQFLASGRSAKGNAIFDHIRRLAQFRKANTCLQNGKLMQFVPEDGLYVYFRYDEKGTVMCIMNTAGQPRQVDPLHFRERTNGFVNGRDIPTGDVYPMSSAFSIRPWSMLVLQLE